MRVVKVIGIRTSEQIIDFPLNLKPDEDGTVRKEQRQFGGFKRDKRALERHVLQYGRRRPYYLQLLRSSSTPAQSAPTSH